MAQTSINALIALKLRNIIPHKKQLLTSIIIGIMFSIGFYYIVGLLAPVLLSSIDLFNSVIILYTVFVIILAMGIGTIFGVIRTFNNVTK